MSFFVSKIVPVIRVELIFVLRYNKGMILAAGSANG